MLTEYVKRLKVKYHLFEAFTVESEGILQLSDVEHCLLLEHSIESFMGGETTMEYNPESGTFIFHMKPAPQDVYPHDRTHDHHPQEDPHEDSHVCDEKHHCPYGGDGCTREYRKTCRVQFP